MRSIQVACIVGVLISIAQDALGLDGKLSYPMITVRCLIGGNPATALIDTGASGILIDAKFATEGKLKDAEARTNETAQTPRGPIPLVRLASVEFKAGNLTASPDCEFFKIDLTMISRIIGHPVEAIAGMGFLKDKCLILDSDSQTFNISTNSGGIGHKALGKPSHVDKLRYTSSGLPLITLAIPSGVALFDTGGTPGLSAHSEFYEQLSLVGRARRKKDYRQNFQLSGTTALTSIWNANIRVAEFPDVQIEGTVNEKPSEPGDRDFEVGTGFIRKFNWVIDFQNDRISFCKSKDFGKPTRTDGSGIGILRVDGKVVVIRGVPPDSPGGKAGVIKGDILTHCNEIEVSKWNNLFEIREILSGEDGTAVELKFLRVDKPYVKTIVLRQPH